MANNGQVRQGHETAKEVTATLVKYDKQIAQCIPARAAEMIKPERAIRLVLTETRRIPKLLQCDPQTIVGAMLTAAALGLDIGSHLGHAYVLPFKGTATFVIGYKGLIALAHRSKEVSSIVAHLVRPGDEFSVELGSQAQIIHRPKLGAEGQATAYYAIAHTVGGGVVFERPITHSEMLKIKARSPAVKSGASTPWDTDFEAMAKKSAIRRLAKFLPASADLLYAANADTMLEEAGKRPPPPPELDWFPGFGSEGESLDDGNGAGGALPSGDDAPLDLSETREEAKKT